MNFENFIAGRILSGDKKHKKISTPIVKIAVGGIALGIAVMIITVSIVTGFQKEIRQKIVGFGAHIQITNYDANASDEPQPISKNQDFLHLVSELDGVNKIQVFATKSGLIKTKTDNEGVLLKGVDSDHQWDFIKKNLKEGEVLSISDTGTSRNIIISKSIAKRLELKLQDNLLIYFITHKKSTADSINNEYEQRIRKFNICGIYESGFEEFDTKLVFVDIKNIQELNYWESNQVGGFEVLINDYSRIDELGETINELCGQDLTAQTIKENNATIFSWLELQDVNAVIVIVLMVLVAAINMISALLILILERTNMIGILKAMGASNFLVQKIFLNNAFYLLTRGLLWGNVIALSLCFIQKQFGILTLPQETYYVSVIPIDLNFIYVVALNIGTIIVSMIMLLLPSLIVSNITPVKAIRFS